jgi:hypothetical protein
MFDKGEVVLEVIYGQGIAYYEFISECKTVNKETHTDIVCRLSDAVRKKLP